MSSAQVHRRTTRAFALLLLAGLSGACSSLSSRYDAQLPRPQRIAVLPLSGDLPLRDLDLIREMLVGRLKVRNLVVLDNAWVDHVLSRESWLGDPDDFDAGRLDRAAVAEALGVDGVIAGQRFDARSVQLVLFFRRGLCGRLDWSQADGQERWFAEHAASTQGGLALESGQIVTAIRRTLEHGSSLQWQRLVESWLDTVLGSLPEFAANETEVPAAPVLDSIRVQRDGSSKSGRSVTVEVRGSPGLLMSFEADGFAGTPLSEVQAGVYRARRVLLPEDSEMGTVTVRARDRFGRRVERKSEASRS